MLTKIAITPRSLSASGHPALRALTDAGWDVDFPTPGRQPTPAEQERFLPECVGYLAGVEPVPGDLLRRCPGLRVISRNGTGVDAVDLAAAAELGIAVERTAGANAQGVAELAIALVFALVRSVPWSDRALKSGEWKRRPGVELRGRTLGVVGCGQIGRRVAEMGLGVGMVVRGFDQFEDPAFRPAGDYAWVTLDELLAAADVVSLHCPPGARPLIDAAALARMRRGSYLVNTARAALVDDEAVLAALEDGTLAGFATDVYDVEPPGLTPLLAHDKVVATPHAGALTGESVERATRGAVENLLKVLGTRA
jgi:D-3-phosphoglycerate dehydrogenase / 2-oxoglutarate reductase